MVTESTREYMRLTGRWWELDTHPEVAGAVGMVAAQLDCPPRDAATVLRAHAAAHTRDTVEVALDILQRKLTFTS